MNFINHRVRNLVPYTYGEQPSNPAQTIKLNTNENPYPPHSSIKTALANFDYSRLRFYPDPECKVLRQKAAALYNINVNNIIFGNGSDEIISMIFKIFFEPGEYALFTEYTYSAYKCYAESAGVSYSVLPMADDFSINLDLMEKFRPKVFFLANPNAPTSIYYDVNLLEKYIKKHKNTLFVIDEAYVDFAKESALPLALKYDNCIVLRTFSKAYSFCAGRLGFAMGKENNIEGFYKVRDSYNINMLTQLIGEKTFSNMKYYSANIKKIIKTREKFTAMLNRLNIFVCPSSANFVFAKFGAPQAENLYKYLKTKQIFVRFFNKPNLDQYLRISIGTNEEMEIVSKHIVTFLKTGH